MGDAIRFLGTALLIGALGGCAGRLEPQDGSSSAQGGVAAAPGRAANDAPIYLAAQYDVEEITVVVPRSLRVSEANSYRPNADIVWRGDPVGDRYAQVETIVTEAMATGTAMMTEGPPVDIWITIARFHCLTERTRYSVGGVHAMEFDLTVRDAATGVILDGPRRVNADTPASGGAKAIAEDRAGQTQRAVITERLASVIRRELSAKVAPPTGEAILLAAN